MFLMLLISLLAGSSVFAQQGPYNIKHSEEFKDSKKKLPLSYTSPLANGNVLLTFVRGEKLDNIGLQLFTSDLKQEKSTMPDVKALFEGKRAFLEGVRVLNNKSYFFVREPLRETKTEQLSAVEFSPVTLEIIGNPVKLFETSRGVIGGNYGYSSATSNDKSKIFYKCNLFEKEKKAALNKQEFAFYMFDENMKQIWGGEYEMPYTEAKMSMVDYQVSNDGKLYYLIRVYSAEGRDAESHFEILVYEKGKKNPKVIEFKIDEYTPRAAYLYEDKTNNIVVTGFYSKKGNPSIDGAFMVKLDPANGKFTKLGGGYYEIPSDLIKTFMTERQKEKLEKKEKKGENNEKKELGINDLEIRKIHFLDNGSTVIVSEIYYVVTNTYYDGKTTRTTYNTYASDIFVFCIDATGKLSWIKKIPKRQHEGGSMGAGISITSAVKDNHVHLFYVDHIENFTLKEDESPRVHQSRAGGYIAGVDIDEKGNVKKYNLGEAAQFGTNFYMRRFIDGRKDNLVAVERRKKMNMLFSLEIK
ncbi:MAG: hypothetical protein JWO09_2611 [Bacteroidetes bacterium]|nr:hypothetical protein [Bacteroidota bacterium]